MITISLTPYEALEFIMWQNRLKESVHHGELSKPAQPDKMVAVINSINRQIQSGIFKDFTVGTFNQSHVQELTAIINNQP